MAKEKLNKAVDDYFKSIAKVDAEKITADMVEKYLDVKSMNDYGGVAHAIVNYEYDEEKVLKTIKLLLDMGLNPNYKAKRTGYTFIHLALYGFTTSKNEDESYSTSFIVSLIEMSKKKGLDVNIKDKDGDTIVHTAFASEVYMGEVLPIIKALLPEFKMDAVDANGRDILGAMEFYLACAKKGRITGWTNRLNRQKEEITNFIKGMNEEEVLKKKEELDKKLDSLIDSLSVDDLKLDEIDALKREYEDLNSLIVKNKFDFDKIYDKLHNKISLLLEKKLKDIVGSPSLKKIEDFENLMKRCSFYKSSVDINEIKVKYQNKLKEYESAVNRASSLDEINNARKLIVDLVEKELKEKLELELDKKIDAIKKAIANLISLREKNINLLNFLGLVDGFSDYQENAITLSELTSLLTLENDRYNDLNIKVNKLLALRIREVIQPFTQLAEQGLIDGPFLNDIIQVISKNDSVDKGNGRKKVRKNEK